MRSLRRARQNLILSEFISLQAWSKVKGKWVMVALQNGWPEHYVLNIIRPFKCSKRSGTCLASFIYKYSTFDINQKQKYLLWNYLGRSYNCSSIEFDYVLQLFKILEVFFYPSTFCYQSCFYYVLVCVQIFHNNIFQVPVN